MYEDSKLSSHQSNPSYPKASSSRHPQSSSSSQHLQHKPFTKAIEDYRKLCLKSYSTPNQSFISLLKSGDLCLFLNSYTLKDIFPICKIIAKHFLFKQIILSPFDPQKGDPNEHRRRSKQTATSPLTPGEKDKQNKEQHEQRNSQMQMLSNAAQAISKNLSASNKVIIFSLYQLNLTSELTSTLSKGISDNKSLQGFCVRNCVLPLDAYEILLKGFLTHERIEFLDFSENNLSDKYGNMISRIIARQTQRRDQVIWAYSLRNERPLTNDYTKGLISINLSGNKLGDMSAEQISNALVCDQYIRAINLSSNDFSCNACKKFIYMMRKNYTILMINLKDNYGYDSNIHARLVMKMANNIKVLYQQFSEKVFEMEEFVNLKGFIDPSFFDIDMPEEIAREFIEGGANNGVIKEEEEEGEEEREVKGNKVKQLVRTEQGKAEDEPPVVQKQGDAMKGSDKAKEPKKKTKNKDEQRINVEDVNKILYDDNERLKQELSEIRANLLEQGILLQQSEYPNKLSDNAMKNYNKIVTVIDELNNLMEKVEESIQKDLDDDEEEEDAGPPVIKEEEEELKSASRDSKKNSKSTTKQEQKQPQENEDDDNEEEGDYKYQEMQAEPSEPNEDRQGYSNAEEDEDDEDQQQRTDNNTNVNEHDDINEHNKNIMVNQQEMLMMRNEDSNDYDYDYDDDDYDPPSLDIKKRLNNSR